jgi:hypothetical protein
MPDCRLFRRKRRDLVATFAERKAKPFVERSLATRQELPRSNDFLPFVGVREWVKL